MTYLCAICNEKHSDFWSLMNHNQKQKHADYFKFDVNTRKPLNKSIDLTKSDDK